MTSQEIVKRDGIKLPASGCVFVQTLKKNIAKRCLVIRVGKVNTTIEINGVEAKVPNDQVQIDDPEDDDE